VRPEDVGPLIRAGAHGVATIRGAGWYEGSEASAKEVDLKKTHLATPADSGVREPITRYISSYDAESERGRDDHPAGERRPTGTGRE